MDEDTLTLKPRHIENQNVVHRLERRRISSGPPGAHWYRVRCFHQNLFPNFTVVNVEKPPCFLRKFSPDGRCFIAFSADQTSLEVKNPRLSGLRLTLASNLSPSPDVVPPTDLRIPRLPGGSGPVEGPGRGDAPDGQRPVLPQRPGTPVRALFLFASRHERGLQRGAPEPGVQPLHGRLPIRDRGLGCVRPRGAASLLLRGSGSSGLLDVPVSCPDLTRPDFFRSASSRCIGTTNR